jgi:hypothetical protein
MAFGDCLHGRPPEEYVSIFRASIVRPSDFSFSTGKAVRINLAKRLELPQFHDGIAMSQRHFEAEVPSPRATLSQKISCSRVSLALKGIEKIVGQMEEIKDFAFNVSADGSVELYVSVDPKCLLNSEAFKAVIAQEVHGYLVPETIYLLHGSLVRLKSGETSFEDARQNSARLYSASMSRTELHIRDLVSDMLSVDLGNITPQSDFFLLGGTSLLLGKLAYQIRKDTGAQVGVSTLFNNSTIAGIAALVDTDSSKRRPFMLVDEKDHNLRHSTATSMTALGLEYDYDHEYQVFEKQKARGQNHPICLIVQAIPLVFFYPLKAALTCKCFPTLFGQHALIVLLGSLLLFTLSYIAEFLSGGFWIQLGTLLAAILASRAAVRFITPIVAILFKWVAVGRYREGTYRM